MKPIFCRTLSISQLKNIEKILSTLSSDDLAFISLHISEEVDDDYIENYKKLCGLIKNKKIKLIADVSKKTKEIFNMSLKEVGELLNIDVLRIDYGISLDEIKELSTKFVIAINASTIQENELNEILVITKNIIGIHNYYPRPETGLDFEYFDKQNDIFIRNNIPVYCFIKGSNPYRLPIKEGLPTLESQRKNRPYISYVQLAKYKKINGVIVGDPYIDDKEVILIKEYINKDIISLKASIDTNELYDKVFTNRIDSPACLIRIKESREYSCFGKLIEPKNNFERNIGSITIDNERYSRYSGEIMIVRSNLPKDERVNVIGQIDKDYLPLLKFISGGDKIKLIK